MARKLNPHRSPERQRKREEQKAQKKLAKKAELAQRQVAQGAKAKPVAAESVQDQALQPGNTSVSSGHGKGLDNVRREKQVNDPEKAGSNGNALAVSDPPLAHGFTPIVLTAHDEHDDHGHHDDDASTHREPIPVLEQALPKQDTVVSHASSKVSTPEVATPVQTVPVAKTRPPVKSNKSKKKKTGKTTTCGPMLGVHTV